MPFKHLLWIALSLFAINSGLSAQETLATKQERPGRQFYLKTNPLTVFQGPIPLYFGEIRLGAELVGSERISYQFGGSYLFKSPILSLLTTGIPRISGTDYRVYGYRVQVQVRYYYFKFNSQKNVSRVLTPSGLYAAIHTSYSNGTIDAGNPVVDRIEITHLNVNLLAGIQLMYSDVVGIDLFTGIGYKNNVITEFSGSGRKTYLEPEEFGYGVFYASPVKFSLGFNLTFGIL